MIVAVPTGQPGVVEYKLTEAGEDLRPVVMSLGIWGQRWVESSLSLKNLDPSLLMWDMRRSLDPDAAAAAPLHHQFPVSRSVTSAKQSWWLVIDGGTVDLCSTNPGFEVDLYVRSSLRSMTAVWMGLTTVQKEIDAGQIELIGDKAIAQLDAAMAGPQPVRQGKEPRRGLTHSVGRTYQATVQIGRVSVCKIVTRQPQRQANRYNPDRDDYNRTGNAHRLSFDQGGCRSVLQHERRRVMRTASMIPKRHDDDVVQVSQNGDKIGYQVDGRECIGSHAGSGRLSVPRDTGVAGSEIERMNVALDCTRPLSQS